MQNERMQIIHFTFLKRSVAMVFTIPYSNLKKYVYLGVHPSQIFHETNNKHSGVKVYLATVHGVDIAYFCLCLHIQIFISTDYLFKLRQSLRVKLLKVLSYNPTIPTNCLLTF